MARRRQRRGPEDYLRSWEMFDDYSDHPDDQRYTFSTIVPLNGKKSLIVSFVKGVKLPEWPDPFEIRIFIITSGNTYEGVNVVTVRYDGGSNFEDAARNARAAFQEATVVRGTSTIARSVIQALLDRFDGLDGDMSALFFEMAHGGNPPGEVLDAIRILAGVSE